MERIYKGLKELGMERKFKNVKVSEIKETKHGKQIFVHDPSGVLWHFFEFSQEA